MCFRTFQRVSEWRNSETLWSAQVTKLPDHPYGFSTLGKVLENSGRKQEALACYFRAMQLGTKDRHTFYNMGNLLVGMKKYPQAEEAYLYSLELAPGYVEVIVNLGALYMIEGRYGEAEALFLRSLNFNFPHKFLLYMNLAIVYEKTMRPVKALELVRQALECKPNDPGALNLLERLSKESNSN